MKFGNNMSRIGQLPIEIPKEVTVTMGKNNILIKGVKGELEVDLPVGISVAMEEDKILVRRKGDDGKMRAIHGLIRALIQNHVSGVSKGWQKTLEMVGVGYRAQMSGTDLTLTVGFSHPVVVKPPVGIQFAVTDGKILVSGFDRQAVGQAAADIRNVKKPEPYKGKGIRYSGEVVRRKAGKAAKAVGGAAAGK